MKSFDRRTDSRARRGIGGIDTVANYIAAESQHQRALYQPQRPIEHSHSLAQRPSFRAHVCRETEQHKEECRGDAIRQRFEPTLAKRTPVKELFAQRGPQTRYGRGTQPKEGQQ